MKHHASKHSVGKGPGRRGSTLIYAIVALTIIASLTAAVATMVPSSYKAEISADTTNRARYLAEAGYNYAQGLNWQMENDSTKTLADVAAALEGYTYTFPGATGTFTLDVTSQNTPNAGDFTITSTGTVGGGNEKAVYVMTPQNRLTFISQSSNKPAVSFGVSGTIGGTPSLTWNGATGTVHGTPTVIQGPGVLGVHFDTNCEAISVTFASSLAWTPSGTIMIWIYMDSFEAWQGIMHKGVSTHSNDPYGVFDDEVWSLQFTDNGLNSPYPNQGLRKLTFLLIASNTQVAAVNQSSNMNSGQWYHVAVTWWKNSDTDKGMNMYINGVLNNTTGSYLVPRDNNSDITIGAQSYMGSCYTLNGSIADVQMWNRVLPLTSATLTDASIERAYCHGALALGGAPSMCNKYNTAHSGAAQWPTGTTYP
jgi:hypothetical protein